MDNQVFLKVRLSWSYDSFDDAIVAHLALYDPVKEEISRITSFILSDNNNIVTEDEAINRIRIDKAGGQRLIDDLWLMGFRPTYTSAERAALEKSNQQHLEDLRTITFRAIDTIAKVLGKEEGS